MLLGRWTLSMALMRHQPLLLQWLGCRPKGQLPRGREDTSDF
jgi:hypothetical protein